MTVVGPNVKKKRPSKRNPGAKKSDGTKAHISAAAVNRRAAPKPKMKKEDELKFNRRQKFVEEKKKARAEGRVIAHPKKPDKPKAKPRDEVRKQQPKRSPRPGPAPDKNPKKPRNKRTGEDYLDREKKGWGGSRGGKARPLNLDDLRERIKKDKEGRKNRRKTLPYKI